MHIIGSKIILRDQIEADLEPMAFWLQPGHAWKKLDAPYYPLMEPEKIPAYIERERQARAKPQPEPRSNLVIADAESNHMIGQVSTYWESIETLWLSMGIVIYDPAFWGKGIGFEAMGLWTDYQFQARPEIVRLDLRTWSGNYGMIAVSYKLGFVQEACFRHARIVDGMYYDSLAFGILREEWQDRYPDGFKTALECGI